MTRQWPIALAWALSGASVAAPPAAFTPEALRNGSSFAPAQVRQMQADEFANPGMLWVERGQVLWNQPAANGKSCAGCHQDAAASMRGVAARYPALAPDGKQLLNLEGRINRCRQMRQLEMPWAVESPELLAMAALLSWHARGQPKRLVPGPELEARIAAGRKLYFRRQGQMNLACTHCHDQLWGRRLGTETISQGHPTGFPAYRLEWQTLGSLARRLRACYSGIRAEMPAYGAPELLDLESYLAWRAQGLALEAPGVRR